MAVEVGQLYQKLELRDKGFESGMSNAMNMSGKLQTALKVGVAGAAAGVAVALGKMAKSGAENIQEVRDAAQRFRQETGASEEQAEEFSDTIKELHKNNTDSYEELGDTVTALRQRFGEASKGMEQDMLDFAKVTGQDGARAVEELHSVMEAWDVEVENSSELMDKMMGIHQETGMEVRSLQKGLQDTAPAMKALGIELDEGMGIMGQFAERGVSATKAQRGFRQMMQRMADPTKQQAESLEKLGIAVEETEDGFKTGDGALETFMGRLDEGDLSAEEMASAMDILGRRSGEKIVQAMKDGEAGVESMMKTLEESEGSVKEASEQYDLQLGERWTLIKRKYLEPFMETMGTGLINILEKVLVKIEEWAPKISSFFETFKSAASDAESFAGSMKNVGKAFKGMLPEGIQERLDSIMNFLSSLGSVVEENIPSIVSEFEGLKEAWRDFIDVFTDTLSGDKSPGSRIQNLKDIFESSLDAILEIVKNSMKAIKGVLKIGEGVFSGDWETALEGIKEVYKAFRDTFLESLKTAKENIISLLKLAGVWDEIKSVYKEQLGNIKDILKGWKEDVIGTFEGLRETVTGLVEKMLDTIKSFFKDKLNAVKDRITGWAKSIGGTFQGLYDKVSGNSIIPDMMEDIREEFAGMAGDTEITTQDWTGNIESEFGNMDSSLRGMVDGLTSDISSQFADTAADIITGSKGVSEGLGDLGKSAMGTAVEGGGNWLADEAAGWFGSAIGTSLGGPFGSALGKAGGDIAGDLIGKGVDWVGNLLTGGGKSESESERSSREATEKIETDASTASSSQLASVNESILGVV
ncbi:MAG: phage tail tape measure protein, partial [Candidatus Acetothermia bacterium]